MSEEKTIGEKMCDNWNRLSRLTKHRHSYDSSEIAYRIGIQNYYSQTGTLPDDYIPPHKGSFWTPKRRTEK